LPLASVVPPIQPRFIVRIVNVELHENMEFAYTPSIPPPGAQRTWPVGRSRIGGYQIPSGSPSGEPGAAAPTRRPASLSEAAETHLSRSTPLGVAVRCLERLAIWCAHRWARNRHCLAPQGLPAFLDMESPSWPGGPTGGPERRACFGVRDAEYCL